ncbi:MAG TPA: hypothetical protein VMC09_04805 [Anaerolineales bacterium]|nr:hypothetical protein [Anaerolineales bacterium]
MSKNSFTLIILLTMTALLLGLAGCGGVGTANPGSATVAGQPVKGVTIDACALLTKADAEQILGKPVEDPTHPVEGSETFNVFSCEYKMQGGTALDNASLIVTVPAAGDLQTAQIAFDTGKQQAQAAYNAAPVDVPGLGDTAYWVGGAGNNLSILKGDINVTLSASTQKGDAPAQAILDLAKTVLSRLP